jgi:tetratricopeptide (TPR) repeat protein
MKSAWGSASASIAPMRRACPTAGYAVTRETTLTAGPRDVLIALAAGALTAGAIPWAWNGWIAVGARRDAESREVALRIRAQDWIDAGDPALALVALAASRQTHTPPLASHLEARAISAAVLAGHLPSTANELAQWHFAVDTEVSGGGRTAETLVALGRLQRARGQRESGLTTLRAAAEGDPDHPGAVLAFAEALDDEGDDAETLPVARRAVALIPTSGTARLIVGRIMLRQGKPTEALALLSTAVHALPADPSVHHALGSTHSALHDWGRAAASYETALRLAPEQFDSRVRLAEVLEKANRPRAALETYEALWAKTGDITFHRAVGRIALQMGDHERAHRVLAEVVEYLPADAESHWFLGAIAEAAGRRDLAIRHLEACAAAPLTPLEGANVAAKCAEALATLPRNRNTHR